jgi:hypothetical protein
MIADITSSATKQGTILSMQTEENGTRKVIRLFALYSWNVFALNRLRIASSCKTSDV